MRVLLSALAALLVAAPAASAQMLPKPVVQSGPERVEGAPSGYYASSTDGTVVHSDPLSPVTPTQLKTTPGSDVTVALGPPVTAVTAVLAGADVPVAAVGEGMWKVTLPAAIALPATLSFQGAWSDATTAYTQRWSVDLVAAYVAPMVYPAPPPQVSNPPGSVVERSLKVTGRRFSVTLACAA